MTEINKTTNEGGQSRPLFEIDGYFSRIEYAFNLVAAGSILILMLLAVVQILGRTLLNFPVPGFIDITEQAMAVFAFLGISYCQKVGGHIRMGLVLGKLTGRKLWFAELIGVVLIWLLITLLVVGAWTHFQRAWILGDSTIDISLPVWPSKLVIPVAFSLLWLRLVLQICGYIRLLTNPKATPVAIPINVDITKKAQREIESAFGGDGKSELRS